MCVCVCVCVCVYVCVGVWVGGWVGGAGRLVPLKNFFIEIQLIYNVMLVSGI